MQLTRAAEYAMRVMIHLASQTDGTRVRLKSLADESGVPENFLAKLLQSLSKAELVLSQRGPTGGFELAPHARAATMLDVLQAIEGPVALNVCLGESGCERQKWCPAHEVWTRAQSAMVDELRKSTLGELAATGRERRIAFDNRAITGENIPTVS